MYAAFMLDGTTPCSRDQLNIFVVKEKRENN